MLKRVLDFFKRILPGGKHRVRGIPLESILSRVISKNLQALTGEEPAVEVSLIGFDEFEEILGGLTARSGGYVLHAFAGDERAPLSLLFPPECIEAYRKKAAAPDTASSGTESLHTLLAGLDGGLSQLFFITPSADTGRAVDYEKIQPLRAVQVLPTEGSGGLLWRASGCCLYRVRTGETFFFIMTDAEKDTSLRTELSENSRFISFVENSVIIRDEAPAGENPSPAPSALGISRPGEFMLGRLFLPPWAYSGGKAVQSIHTGISVTRQIPLPEEEPGTWMKLDVESGTGRITLHYFFPLKDSADTTLKYIRQGFAALITGAIRLLMRTVHSKPVKISAAAAVAPSFPENSPLLVLSAGIIISGSTALCRIYIRHSVLAILMKNLLHPGELDLLRAGPAQILRAVFLLNEALIRKYTDDFFKTAISSSASSKLLKDPAPRPILFHEFASRIGDHDLRIIVQNHLIRELEPISLSSLFYYFEGGATAGDNEVPLLIRFLDSDESRFKKFLPETIQAEWERNAGLGMGTHCENEAAFLEFNIRIMNGIYRSVRDGRLLLSARALYLLKAGFHRVLQGRFEARLWEAREKNIPFAQLRALPRKVLQELLMHTDNRSLCLALTGLENELDFLARNISRRRLDHLRSDLEYFGGLYRKNLIDSEEVLAIKETVQQAALELLENQKQ